MTTNATFQKIFHPDHEDAPRRRREDSWPDRDRPSRRQIREARRARDHYRRHGDDTDEGAL